MTPTRIATAIAWSCTALVLATTAWIVATRDDDNTHGDPRSAAPSIHTDDHSPAPAPGSTASDQPDAYGGADWRAAAQGYAVAFTNTTGGHGAWLERLRPWIGPGLAQGYGYTDVEVVPVAKFEDLELIGRRDTETPTYAVRLNYAGDLSVDVTISQIPDTKRWVVATAVPAQTDTPPDPAHTHEEPT